MYKTREEVENWLKEMKINNYVINKDLTVDVDNHVIIKDTEFTQLPVQFGKVEKNFSCYNGKLLNLKGFPKDVKGNVSCYNNQITSLEGCPEKINGNFNCSHNKLSNLNYCTQFIKKSFICNNNELTSLEGCPKEIKSSFNCSHNNLTSLKYSPISIEVDFNCSHNKLTNLENCNVITRLNSSSFNTFDCSHNELTSLKLETEKLTNFRINNVICNNNKLTDLQGCPKITASDEMLSIYADNYILDCSYNNLTNLEGAPEKLNTFIVNNNKLKNFDNFPIFIKRKLWMHENLIEKKELLNFKSTLGEYIYSIKSDFHNDEKINTFNKLKYIVEKEMLKDLIVNNNIKENYKKI